MRIPSRGKKQERPHTVSVQLSTHVGAKKHFLGLIWSWEECVFYFEHHVLLDIQATCQENQEDVLFRLTLVGLNLIDL
jgi:hypothetical protein